MAESFTMSHTGSLLGVNKVTRSQNTANDPSTILTFECPRKFEQLDYRGSRDPTRFVPRTLQTETGTAGDDTVVSLNSDIQPVAGETDIPEQDFPAVVAYNVTQGSEIDIASVDYSANEVTLASDPADGDTVKLWPVLNEGTIQYIGRNSLGQNEGPVYPWPTPIHKFLDFPQNKRGREVNLHGFASWSRYEQIELVFESPHQIVWEDDDYPRGDFVSTFEQDIQVTL